MAYRKYRYGRNRHYGKRRSGGWNFSKILSLGFHGSIQKWKKDRATAKHNYKVGLAKKASSRRKFVHNIRTFFSR